MKMTVFWDVPLLTQAVSTSETSISVKLHGTTSQKTVIFIFSLQTVCAYRVRIFDGYAGDATHLSTVCDHSVDCSIA
jgi:hypothetical protein